MILVSKTDLPPNSRIAEEPTESWETPVASSIYVKTVYKPTNNIWHGVEFWETTVGLKGRDPEKTWGAKDANYSQETALLWHNATVYKVAVFLLEQEYATQSGVQLVGNHTTDPDSAFTRFVSDYSPKL